MQIFYLPLNPRLSSSLRFFEEALISNKAVNIAHIFVIKGK